MSKVVDAVSTGVLVIAAVSVAAVAVHRELADRPRGMLVAAPSGPPTYVPRWEQFAAVGTWIGDSNAKVRIVEFADFECPFCRRFHESFQLTRKEVGRDVALLLVQYPLGGHRFARPAAYAAECAAKQGKWEDFQNLLFAKQDSFGLKSWTSYAIESGVRDTAGFVKCVTTTTKSARIDSGVVAAAALKLHGTPTVLIDGWRQSVTPYDSLLSLVRSKLKPNP